MNRILLLPICLAGLALAACKPNNSVKGSAANPDTSFNVIEVNIAAILGSQTIPATWKKPDGDNLPGSPDLSQATLTLKPNTEYTLLIETVTTSPLITNTQPAINDYSDPVVLNEATLTPATMFEYAKDYLFRLSASPAGAIQAINYTDSDQTNYLDLVNPANIKPVGRIMSLTTGNAIAGTGTLTIQLLRRADKSSLAAASTNPAVVAPLASGSLGTQIEDFQIDFALKVEN